jgi:nucleoside-triphosphatase THEP1
VSRPRAILLVGPLFAGKSRFVERLAAELTADGRRVAGFVQRGVFAADGRKTGYDLVGLASGAVAPLARRSAGGDRWEFHDAAFAAARAEIRDGDDLALIDELGHLELAGQGHAAAIGRALSSAPVVLVVVRDSLADGAVRWLSGRADVEVVRFGPGRDEEIIATIRATVGKESGQISSEKLSGF